MADESVQLRSIWSVESRFMRWSYGKWKVRWDSERPGATDNGLRAVRMAYGAAAALWSWLSAAVGFPAALMWSFAAGNHWFARGAVVKIALTCVLSSLTVLGLTMTIWRQVQMRRVPIPKFRLRS